jgi:hypothetical protein
MFYPGDLPHEPEISPCQLRHLQLDVYDAIPQITLQALLKPSRDTLSRLHLSGVAELSTIGTLASILAGGNFPCLQSLVLDNSESEHYPILSNLLAALPLLSTLEMPHMNEDDIRTIAAEPRSLSTLALTATGERVQRLLQALLDAVKSFNLNLLHRIEIPKVSWSDLEEPTGFALLEECEKRSIALLCRYGFMYAL